MGVSTLDHSRGTNGYNVNRGILESIAGPIKKITTLSMLEAQYNRQRYSLAIVSFHSPQLLNSWPTTLGGREREPGQGLLHHSGNREANSEVEKLVRVPWVVNGRAGVQTQVCLSLNPMFFLYILRYICSSLLIQDSK